MNKGTDGREAWGVGVAVALIAALLHSLLDPRSLVHSMSDEALLLPLGLRQLDPGVYAGDRWLEAASHLFSIPYSYLMGTAMAVVSEPVTALRLVALPFHVVFLAGAFRLARSLGGGRRAAYLTVGLLTAPLLALEPRIASALDPVLPHNHAVLASLGLPAGAALPRDLVFALFPFFCVRVLTCVGEASATTGQTARRWTSPVLFLCIGLLANLHPLTALHMGVLLLAATWWLRGPATSGALRRVAVGALCLGLGALPYAIQFATVERGPDPAPAELLSWRIPGIGTETWTGWASRMEPLLWLSAAALALICCRSHSADASDRTRPVRWWALGAVVVAGVGPLVAVHVEPLRQVQLDRLGRFAAVLLVVLLAVLLTRAWAAGRRRRAWVAVSLAAMVVVAPPLVRAVAGGGGKRGPLEAALRRIEREATATRVVPPGLVTRDTPGDPSRPRLEGASEAFIRVCAFVRRETGRGDLFLVPPEDFGAFRLHARRPTSVTRKDGGFALTFLRSRGEEWFAEYAEAVRTYAVGSDADWRALADRYGAAFVVTDSGSQTPAAWPVLLDAEVYRVVRVP